MKRKKTYNIYFWENQLVNPIIWMCQNGLSVNWKSVEMMLDIEEQ